MVFFISENKFRFKIWLLEIHEVYLQGTKAVKMGQQKHREFYTSLIAKLKFADLQQISMQLLEKKTANKKKKSKSTVPV